MRARLAALALLAACTQFPQLDAVVSDEVRRAPYPALLPLDQLIAGPAPRIEPSLESDLKARAAALRARAARLSGPVVAPNERRRMARGVTPR